MGDVRLHRCPHCGASADLIHDVLDKTWIAICSFHNCRASVHVHYGRKRVVPLGTIRLRDPGMCYREVTNNDAELLGLNKCITVWNNNKVKNDLEEMLWNGTEEVLQDERNPL